MADHWIYIAGQESLGQFRETSRPFLGTWTTRKASEKGDIVAFYARAPVQAFVALARQCSEPRESRRNRGQWFAWFQFQPLGHDVRRTEVQARKGLSDWGVLRNLQGEHKRIPDERQASFFRLLTSGNEKLAARIDKWSKGQGVYPAAELVPLGELRKESWDRAEEDGLGDDHERWLSEEIADRMVRRREARWFRDSDNLPGSELEHHLVFGDGESGKADIVLVSRQHARHLLLVEVKKQAALSPAKNPVPQVLRYRDALLEQNPGWQVKPIIAACEYQDAVLRAARSARVERWQYNRKRGRLAKVE